MMLNSFKLSLLLLLTTLITGCSGYSQMVNAFGPDAPHSELRDAIEAPYQVAEGESPFCAMPVDEDPEMQPAITAIPPQPYLARLYFINDKAELTSLSNTEAQKIYQEIASRQIAEALLVGHTDTTASHEYNMALSIRRAEKVRQDLIRIGVPEDIIKASGAGQTQLRIPTADNVAEARNRRVEIEIR